MAVISQLVQNGAQQGDCQVSYGAGHSQTLGAAASVPLLSTRYWRGLSSTQDLPAFDTCYSHGQHPAHSTAVPPVGTG